MNEKDFNKYKNADTIEELCDFCEIDYVDGDYRIENNIFRKFDIRYIKLHIGEIIKSVYFGIKTDKGLIYVAKMNEKGELELL